MEDGESYKYFEVILTTYERREVVRYRVQEGSKMYDTMKELWREKPCLWKRR